MAKFGSNEDLLNALNDLAQLDTDNEEDEIDRVEEAEGLYALLVNAGVDLDTINQADNGELNS